jgi:hypothetical protein
VALEQLSIHEIVKQAVEKRLDIPEFQREFVWDPEQTKLLAESLYRDYPVGSFLLWDSSDYVESKLAEGAQASLWIVDGQQRTTALCLLLGRKPYWWPNAEDWNKALKRYDVLVKVGGEEGENAEFSLPNPIRRTDPSWVSVRDVVKLKDVKELTPLAEQIAQAIDPEADLKLFARVHQRLQQLWQIRERDIPIMKVSHEVEDVAEIFARLNQAGTRVKEADVVLALAAARNPGWVRTEYLPFVDGLEERGWDLEAGIFVRAMTSVGYRRARLIEVPKSFWAPDNLPGVWTRTSKIISETIIRLAEHGIVSAALLPSANSLIPLFVLQDRWGGEVGFNFRKSLHWFLLANREGRYSGSAITALNEDVRAISESDSLDDALTRLLERLQTRDEIAPEEFMKRYDRAGNRFLRLMVYLVTYAAGGVDWIDKTRIAYDKGGNAVLAGFEPQWHHVFPRKVLKATGRSPDAINALANIAVLNERTNVKKLAAKRPAQYLVEHGITAKELQGHAMPRSFLEAVEKGDAVLEWQWAVGRYDDFLKERRDELARRSTVLLRSFGVGQGIPAGFAQAEVGA